MYIHPVRCFHSKTPVAAALCCAVLVACGAIGKDETEMPSEPPLVEAVPAGFGALPIEEVVKLLPSRAGAS